MTLEPKDELVHEYPKPLEAHWKENWYFNFIDRKNRAWGVNHFSLERHESRGRFSAFHVVDDQVLSYSNLIAIDDSFQELTDGKLKAEFLEPFQRFRLTFIGPQHQVELNYKARFDVFDYAMGKDKALVFNHYEQAQFVKGALTKDGRTRPIECFGHRDHSWGYRNESIVTAWNWVAVQFADKTINLTRVEIGKAFLSSGFVSSAEGNRRVTKMTVENTKFDGEVPVSSTYTGFDETGKAWRLASEKFSTLFLPMQEKGDDVIILENFSDYTNLDSGERGVGIDEYLINPAVP